MDPSLVLIAAASLVWLVPVILLLGDVIVSIADSSLATSRLQRGAIGPKRVTGLAWLAAVSWSSMLVSAALVVGSVVLVARDGAVLLALAVLALAALAVLALVAAVLAVIARDETTGYRSLVLDLEGFSDGKPSRAQLDEFAARLSAADAHRARGWSRRATLTRWVPVVLSAWLVVVIIVAATASSGGAVVVLAAAAILVPGATAALAAAAVGLARRASGSWMLVDDLERQRAVELVLGLERRAGKRNAGLGDRVARALQILREQQQ